MTVEEHIAALRGLLKADHETFIAEIESWADEAAAAGDAGRERRHRGHADRLRAMPYPWEKSAA